MDEVTESRIKVEVELHQEKVDFISDACEKGLRYWKRVALESVSTENKTRGLIELAPRKVIRVLLQSLKLQISRLFRARSSLTFRQI